LLIAEALFAHLVCETPAEGFVDISEKQYHIPSGLGKKLSIFLNGASQPSTRRDGQADDHGTDVG
jgi:hypothetical protein